MKLNKQYTVDELMSFVGKEMKMVCVDGEVITGKVYGYTSEYDSDDGYVHIDIYSDRIGCVVDVGENEISQYSLA